MVERTLKRKAQEAVLAYRIEKDLTKDEILERYLNTIYYGHGAYGIESAAQTYYGKHAADLDLAQASSSGSWPTRASSPRPMRPRRRRPT